MSSDLDLDSIYTFAIQLGKDAGQLLQDAAQRRMSGEDQLEEVEKLNSVDIVTKTDEGKICLNNWKPISYKADVADQC
jgi:myo-inositol-1(or 4)-monophosphatase